MCEATQSKILVLSVKILSLVLFLDLILSVIKV